MDNEELKRKGQDEESPIDSAGNTINKVTDLAKKSANVASKLGPAAQAAPVATTESAAVGAGSATSGAAAGELAGETLAGAGAATVAAEAAEGAAVGAGSATIQAAVSSVGTLAWAAIGTIVLIIILTLIVSLLGSKGGFVGNNLTNPPTDTDTGIPLPKILLFNGGKAYLSCSKSELINCQNLNTKNAITLFAIFYVDDSFSDDKNKALATIGPFSESIFDVFFKPSIKPRADTHVPLSTTYTWKLSTILKSAEKGPNPNQYIISLGVGKPLKGDPTQVSLTLTGFSGIKEEGSVAQPEGDIYIGANSLATNNTCQGKYSSVMKDLSLSWPEMGGYTNFADPLCTYTPAKFKQVLEATEQKKDNIPFWADIVRTEAAIMTVGGLRNSEGKIINHTNGPFGKFQMGRSTPPGKKWSQVSARGDVTWQKQIENAVGYNKTLAKNGNNFGYWGTAMCLCWFNKYRNSGKGWCDDIIKTKQVRCPAKCTNYRRCSKLTDDVGSENESIDCNSPKMKQCSRAVGVDY